MKSLGQIMTEMGWDRWLEELAQRVYRNTPDHRDPNKFHEEKDEIVSDLRKIRKGERYGR